MPVVPALFLLASLAGLPAWSATGQTASDPARVDVRSAVAAHRAAQRDDIQAQEAAAGRRLTPAERAELREQVRGQWLPVIGTSDDSLRPTPASRATPVGPASASPPPARSQRQ